MIGKLIEAAREQLLSATAAERAAAESQVVALQYLEAVAAYPPERVEEALAVALRLCRLRSPRAAVRRLEAWQLEPVGADASSAEVQARAVVRLLQEADL
jgi:hypothetical protein